MPYLLLTSLIWAFSFGLIKRHLAGLDSGAVASIRLGFALLVFLPFLRLRGLSVRKGFGLVLTGFTQFGLMYVAYLRSFQYLESYQVALFTLMTPLWVTFMNDMLSKRFHPRFLLAAVLAVAGAGWVSFHGWGDQFVISGFLWVQFSNLCFAVGQVVYALRIRLPRGTSDRDVFALMYVGGFIAAAAVTGFSSGWSGFFLNPIQWMVLAYLGLLASGLGFFWWNLGARLVSGGTLAVMNNLKVPLGVACSLLVFGEKVDMGRLIVGGAVILVALWLNEGILKQKN